MNRIALAILYAANDQPRDIAVFLADKLNPITQEEALADGKYIAYFLMRERLIFKDFHPRNPCDTLHLIREMRTWDFPSGVDEKYLLYSASIGQGKCADAAAEELELLE